MRELGAPLVALRLLATDLADLPAGCVAVSTVYPDLLELTFHGDLAVFEAWREALGIESGRVDYHEQGDGRTRVLEAECEFAGARLRLTGFAKTPVRTLAGAV
ncbi:hypothetical protein DT019_12300 [Streptomyces sp. SDr-06]|nr:hypothetical protein DT019_12300 [Streptomyces sp. SDr-06]